MGAADQKCCPFCGGAPGRALRSRDRNRERSQELFVYRFCQQCRSVFLTNVPSELAPYYGGGYYAFRPDGQADWRDNDYMLRFQRDRLALLAKHVSPGSLIEIGAGTGAFAWAAKEAGYEVTAIEMDGPSCSYLEQHLDVRAINSDQPLEVLSTLPKAKVVVMWHVLEHLLRPGEVMEAAAAQLEPGGILAIGVPNPDSLQFRLLRSRWAHLDAPRHLTLIPAAALLARGRALGLSCVELTTDDAFGRHCNRHGWSFALARRPAVGAHPFSFYGGYALRRLLAPLERGGLRGSTLLMMLRRDHER